MHGTNRDQMCREQQQELIQWLVPGDYSISACSARIYACMTALLRRCCVLSPLATVSAQNMLQRRYMHQAEVTKKSATRVLNFWACKEDVGCQDELLLC